MVNQEYQAEESCPFCRIVLGEVSAALLYEDEEVLAFLDNRPATAGHSLVVPRNHARSVMNVQPSTVGRLFIVGRHLLRALKHSSLLCEGVTLALADGEAAGQTIDHVHLHVVPRYKGDGFTVVSPKLQLTPGQMEDAAERIRLSMRETSIEQ